MNEILANATGDQVGNQPAPQDFDPTRASRPAPQLTQYGIRNTLPTSPLDRLCRPSASERSSCPAPRTFREYLVNHARVPLRDTAHGSYGSFQFAGRAPLDFIVSLIDKILANTLHGKTVEIDGITFRGALGAGPACLKGATISVGGGAQFGKTVLILNFQAFATFVEFINFGYYTPDQELLAKIVDTKFRPDVLDQQPWMAEMVQLGKSENASGKAVNRKNSYQCSAAGANSSAGGANGKKAFGHFCGMQKPPTTISLDAAALDEVDDIPARNLGYVDGRMTGSRLQLKFEIGTQRISGAGQNARLKAGSFHVRMYECPNCHQTWNLEETFPSCIRVKQPARDALVTGRAELPLRPNIENHPQSHDSTPLNDTANNSRNTQHAAPSFPESRPPEILGRSGSSALPGNDDPIITPEMGHDRNAHYYCACPNCGTELDRDAGKYVAKNPHRIAEAHFSVRVSQLNISAISLHEIVSAWYTAMADPSGEALTAFYCDRIAIPNAGAAQPITPQVLEQCRVLGLSPDNEAIQPYEMGLAVGGSRFAGLDTGPRCWFWADQVQPGPNGGTSTITACVWAELIASGNAPTRIPQLMQALGITCLFIDAGGEPDLTKRLVLALNGLENFTPPNRPRTELLHSRLSNIGSMIDGNRGLSWDPDKGQWTGLRAAAVLFVSGEAKGIEQTIGFTQDGKIYPLIKCHRGESIQTAVNDFLTPAAGVLEQIGANGSSQETLRVLRTLPRARLPRTYLGPGVSQAVLDSHLLNLRKERDPRTGAEDWIDGVENHLGLAKTYARLATLAGSRHRVPVAYSRVERRHPPIGSMGLGKSRRNFVL